MEYCLFSLQSMKKSNEKSFGFSEKEILQILKDLSVALYDLHSNGIVHLDIKPGFIHLK